MINVATRVRPLLRSVASILLDIGKSGFLGLVTYSAVILAFALSLGGAILLIRILVRRETYISPAPEDTLVELLLSVAALAAGYGCAELAIKTAAMSDDNRRAAKRFLRKCLLWFVSGALFATLVAYATATPP